jgi:hypothetical protein
MNLGQCQQDSMKQGFQDNAASSNTGNLEPTAGLKSERT